jgi:hypothetical protein
LLRISRGERHPRRRLAVERDLERVGSGFRKRDVEDQHRSGLHIHDAGGRLAELDRPFAAEQLVACLVNEPNPDRVDADLRASSANPQHEVRARTDGREAGKPDVLEDAENAELSLLIDEGVVGDEREVEMQGQATRIELMTSFCLMLLTTSIPCRTWPNTVCTRSRCDCGP